MNALPRCLSFVAASTKRMTMNGRISIRPFSACSIPRRRCRNWETLSTKPSQNMYLTSTPPRMYNNSQLLYSITTTTTFTRSSSSSSTSNDSKPSQNAKIGYGPIAAAMGIIGLLSGGVGIYLAIRSSKEAIAAKTLPLRPGCPLVFFDIVDGDEPVGRLVIQLRSDLVPKAAENFRLLSTGACGFGYKKSPLFGAEKARRIFGGDYYGTGAGSHSVYSSGLFDDENFSLPHAGPGVVGMRNFGPNTNGSQFYITVRALPELDGRSEAIGNVVSGWEVLETLDATSKTDGKFGKSHDYRIGQCGEVSAEEYQSLHSRREQQQQQQLKLKEQEGEGGKSTATLNDIDRDAITTLAKEFAKAEQQERGKRMTATSFKEGIPQAPTYK